MSGDKKVLDFKSAGMRRADARDQQASKGTQFGIGNFFGWAMKKYPTLTLGQMEQKMPSLEREYAQEKTMRKMEPDMVPSVNPHEGADLNRLRKLSGVPEVEEVAEAKYKQCKSCKGEGCDHCDGTGKHAIEEESTWTTGSWVVHNGSKVARFKTHNGAKAYAEKNGGKVASSEFYHDNIKKKVEEDSVEKDVIGHVDAEADMIRKELFKMGKYSVELYKMLAKLPDGDFPHWWQAKIVKAGEYLADAKHYLEAELYAPEEESPLDTDQEQELHDINPSGV
tara:strand:+ start:439 stop:1281 length:843 start_codon:yes stop_codon:yes gene_type:complete